MPPDQAVVMWEALKAKGLPTTLMMYQVSQASWLAAGQVATFPGQRFVVQSTAKQVFAIILIVCVDWVQSCLCHFVTVCTLLMYIACSHALIICRSVHAVTK